MENHLDIFSYSRPDECKPVFSIDQRKTLPFRLRFSLYQEAYDYVKLQEREDIDFKAKVSLMRENSQKNYNELTKVKQNLHEDIIRLNKTIKDIQKNVNQINRRSVSENSLASYNIIR